MVLSVLNAKQYNHFANKCPQSKKDRRCKVNYVDGEGEYPNETTDEEILHVNIIFLVSLQMKKSYMS